MSGTKPIRILVVDDSAAGRAAIAELLSAEPDLEVVGRAMDGAEALAMVHRQKPDLITLDLEMPRMDGFTTLRLLRVQCPTPVIVVSTDSRPESSLAALEYGALDFVVKPSMLVGSMLSDMGVELIAKIRAIAQNPNMHPERLQPVFPSGVTQALAKTLSQCPRLIVVGASTGGPVALQNMLSGLPKPLNCPIVVAQHMPAQFTAAFAERLDRMLPMHVHEGHDRDPLLPGEVLICPGGKRSAVVTDGRGGLLLHVSAPLPEDACAPSIDALFESTSRSVAPAVIGVVLTGMGNDGAQGALALERAGGSVVTESCETALIEGMPEETRRVTAHARVLRLEQISRLLWHVAGDQA